MNISGCDSPRSVCFGGAFPVYSCYTHGKRTVLAVFQQLKHLAQQSFKLLSTYIWKWLNKQSFRQENQLINVPFGENQNMPIDVFSSYLLPYLSAKDLYHLFLTRTDYLKLLNNTNVLDKLFSSSEINPFTLASLLEDRQLQMITQLNLEARRGIEQEQIIDLVKKCPNLKSLSLSDCITDSGLQKIVKSTQDLSELDISACRKITYAGLSHINQKCGKLTALNLGNRESITDDIVCQIIEKNPKLKSLTLARCPPTNRFILALSKHCQDLRNLCLDSCSIQDEELKELVRGCAKITSLRFNGLQHVTNTGIRALLENCSNLTDVELVSCRNLTLEVFEELNKSCSSLTHLTLSSSRDLKDKEFQTLTEKFPNLTSFRFIGIVKLTSQAFEALPQSCPHLESLSLGTHGVMRMAKILSSKIDIQALARHCQTLKSLKLNDFKTMTDQAQVIGHGFSNLTDFDFSIPIFTDPDSQTEEEILQMIDMNRHTLENLTIKTHVTDAIMKRLAKCSHLKTLILRSENDVDGRSMQATVNGCSNLTFLELSRIDISDEEIYAIAANCPQLESLRLFCCSKLKGPAFYKLVEKCPNLKNIYFGFDLDEEQRAIMEDLRRLNPKLKINR